MSLVGSNAAVVSLGMSCQSSMQIRKHVDSLSRWLGTRLTASRLPFDWLIVPPEGLCSVLEAAECFPDRPEAVQPRPEVYTSAVLWPRHRLYFWHDFLDGDERPDVPGSFTATAQKYAHAWNKLTQLRGRRVFVLSNTQNNLDWVGSRTGLDFTLTASRIEAVRRALDRMFPDGRNELLVVGYRDRIGDDPASWPAPCYILERDESEFAGDAEQWRAVLQDYFKPGVAAARPDADRAPGPARRLHTLTARFRRTVPSS